jgi:hypothetical protein
MDILRAMGFKGPAAVDVRADLYIFKMGRQFGEKPNSSDYQDYRIHVIYGLALNTKEPAYISMDLIRFENMGRDSSKVASVFLQKDVTPEIIVPTFKKLMETKVIGNATLMDAFLEEKDLKEYKTYGFLPGELKPERPVESESDFSNSTEEQLVQYLYDYLTTIPVDLFKTKPSMSIVNDKYTNNRPMILIEQYLDKFLLSVDKRTDSKRFDIDLRFWDTGGLTYKPFKKGLDTVYGSYRNPANWAGYTVKDLLTRTVGRVRIKDILGIHIHYASGPVGS